MLRSIKEMLDYSILATDGEIGYVRDILLSDSDLLAVRITQLGGAPDLNPAGLASRSHSEYVEGDTLLDMIKEDLVAERVAIESYREIIQFLGNDDSTSRRIMEEILAKEEEHADDLAKLLARLDIKD